MSGRWENMEVSGDLYSLYWEAEKKKTGYPDGNAFMDDLVRFVTMLCKEAVAWKEEEDLSVPLLRNCRYEKKRGKLSAAARAVEHIHIRVRKSLQENISLRYVEIVRFFGLSRFEAFCLLLAVCPDLDPDFEQIFEALTREEKSTRATLQLAVELYSMIDELPRNQIYVMLDRQRPINELLLCNWKEEPNRSSLARPLTASKEVLFELTGMPVHGIDEVGVHGKFLIGTKAPIFQNKDKIEKAIRFVQEVYRTAGKKFHVLVFHGNKGCGKSFALSQIVRESGLSIYEWSIYGLLEKSEYEIHEMLKKVTLQCLLDGSVPCLDHVFSENKEMQRIVEQATSFFRKYFSLLILCGDKPWEFVQNSQIEQMNIAFEQPDSKIRKVFWQYFFEKEGVELKEKEAAELAGRYRLSPQMISTLAAALSRNKRMMDTQGTLTEQVAEELRDQAVNRLGQRAKYIKSCFEWKDLQLSEESLQMLKSACARIRCRSQVQEDWGFAKKLPYGQGISILMYGPPGTGKTMTAQVLAKEVGLDLFRVDLSQIVDKYIGETEKNLGSLFDAAQDINCILFFDEADALFSKRTEVNDSKDKYANVETAYLLQRIEQFPGITILATNNARNFDEAFRRRMSYYINIAMPDKEIRKKIWESVFPKEIEIDPRVDFDELAEKFEFAGSNIKSISIAAAYAAAAAGTPVDRKCIYEAIYIDYLKNGKLLGYSDYPY